jgi:predicted MFS family arabinose efflux permease
MSRDFALVRTGCYLAMLAVGENSTAIMAALAAMANDLGLGATAVEWTINAYLLASAAFIALGGELADTLGPRRSSSAGVALFAVASLIIALAPNGIMVICGRALQGFGAAFAVAGTLAAVTGSDSEAARASGISGWTGFLMLGFSLGPLLGGTITHYIDWRFNFWLNVLAMVLAGLLLGMYSDAEHHRTIRIDWLGLGLLACCMVMLITGLRALPTASSAPGNAILPLALAAGTGAGLLWVEKRHPAPLLDFGLFANPGFLIACLLAFLLMFDIMALLLYYNLFAQQPEGLGWSALAAGFSLLPLSVAFFASARSAARLGSAVGVPAIMVGGSLLLALGCGIAWVSLARDGFVMLMLGLFAAGAGIALPYASAPRIGLAALPPRRAGQGSGVLNSCSFLGGTVGVTCGGMVFALAGFPGVLALVGSSALLGAVLSLHVPDNGTAAGL